MILCRICSHKSEDTYFCKCEEYSSLDLEVEEALEYLTVEHSPISVLTCRSGWRIWKSGVGDLAHSCDSSFCGMVKDAIFKLEGIR